MISAEQFAAGAQQLAAAWEQRPAGEPPWRWVASQQAFAGALGGGYLEMQRTVEEAWVPPAHDPCAPAAGSPPASDDGSSGELWEGEHDPADARRGQGGAARQRLSLACHIVYHPSYQVPVLHFEAADRSGAPLGLDAALAALPLLREAAAGGQPHTVVTQEEHPFLRRPFFQQHPCQTDAVMRLLRGQGDASGDGTAAGSAGGRSAAAPSLLRYMLAWLSVAGPPLGLRVPLDLWRAVER